MINENYKKRLQKLAGLIKENSFIDNNGQLNNFSHHGQYIPGSTKFNFSITFQEIDKSLLIPANGID